MKHQKFILLIVMLAAALIVSACGGAKTTATQNNPTSAPSVSQQNADANGAQSAVNAIKTNAESETGGDEHSDGDEHAATTEAPVADAATATDAEHSDGDEHAAATAESEHNDSEHEHKAMPDEYASKTNPFTGDASAVTAGKQVYTASCTACHGVDGKGDGPAAAALDPHPADFTNTEIMNSMSDTYLFWRISEGGTMDPFNSSMPAWKQGLTEEQRWQVILYLRTFAQ